MKIYSTRHGQTEFNRKELILGTTDIELNETGLRQAEELAEKVIGFGATSGADALAGFLTSCFSIVDFPFE